MIDPNHPATQAQISAALPGNSSWVSANAGSGKTRVLTDRVARLLLGGTQPSHILCLTYTKAAAAEMQNRLFKSLGEWAMMPDAKLRKELNLLGEDAKGIAAKQLSLARTLFARALETPGGLKIQTIHSFCELLLRRFPLEAGVSPQFELLEERQAAQLQREVLEEMAGEPGGSFERIAQHLFRMEPELTVNSILRHRSHFRQPPNEERLRTVLNVPRDLSAKEILEQILTVLPPDRLDQLSQTLASFGKAAEKSALVALKAARADGPDEGRLSGLFKTFLTADGQVRTGRFPTKDVKTADPNAEDQLRMLSEAAVKGLEQQKSQRILHNSLLLNLFATDFLFRFEVRKQALGKIDFDDQVEYARKLLSDREAAAWVQYRLDGGIDHVLVDEAQDTSLVQWDVIDALAGDFFSGSNARDVVRTLFVVGDEKQSIYSFQGADPTAFGAKKNQYTQILDAATLGLEQCDLSYSFRSSSAILSVVDQVFQRNPVHGLGESIKHSAFHESKPGRVDLWNFVEKPDKIEIAPWYEPVDCPPKDAPEQILAAKIARHIKTTLDSKMALPGSEDHQIHAGDFLILVRSRGPLFRAIIQELKKNNVPTAGADRLKVSAELAVRDLMAVLRFLLNDADDLSLASALRSPIFTLSEDDLFTLAHGRAGTLWQQLRTASKHQDTYKELRELRNQADFLRPFELLELLLTSFEKRRAIVARMGSETEEGIDALLDLTLSYEQVEPPTLTGFIEWMDSGEAEVKRQFDSSVGEVRVMTVHGAKGLEAPIVILPETHASSNAGNQPPILFADNCPLLRVTKSQMPAIMLSAEEERQALDQQERWRLLYVAMTRAESWLIICGYGTKGNPEKGWYAAVEEAMLNMDAIADEDGLHIAQDWSVQAATSPPKRLEKTNALPDWISQPAPTLPPALKPISPSVDGGTGHALPGEAGENTEIAMLRGTNLHALLQGLADLPAHDWDAKASGLLQTDNEDEIAALMSEARQVLTAPELKWVFQGEALVEVPIIGHVPALGPRPMRGQIDRVILGDEIWALDFKSNRVVPEHLDQVPDALIGQMALYSAALSEIWPDKKIRTGLIWTATAELTEIPQDFVNSWLQTRWSG